MEKDFDTWNTYKKSIEVNLPNKNFFFFEREIWWASFGINIGVELDGKHELFNRPCIILRKFNKDMMLVVPTTSRDNLKNKYYYKISEKSGGLYIACLSQIRIISSKRLSRKIGVINEDEYRILLTKISDMILGKL